MPAAPLSGRERSTGWPRPCGSGPTSTAGVGLSRGVPHRADPDRRRRRPAAERRRPVPDRRPRSGSPGCSTCRPGRRRRGVRPGRVGPASWPRRSSRPSWASGSGSASGPARPGPTARGRSRRSTWPGRWPTAPGRLARLQRPMGRPARPGRGAAEDRVEVRLTRPEPEARGLAPRPGRPGPRRPTAGSPSPGRAAWPVGDGPFRWDAAAADRASSAANSVEARPPAGPADPRGPPPRPRRRVEALLRGDVAPAGARPARPGRRAGQAPGGQGRPVRDPERPPDRPRRPEPRAPEPEAPAGALAGDRPQGPARRVVLRRPPDEVEPRGRRPVRPRELRRRPRRRAAGVQPAPGQGAGRRRAEGAGRQPDPPDPGVPGDPRGPGRLPEDRRGVRA